MRVLNPFAQAHFGALVHQALTDTGGYSYDLHGLTVVNADWSIDLTAHSTGTGLRNELKRVVATAEAYLRNRLRGFDHFLVLELAVIHYLNRTHCLISPHFHGYVWGDANRIGARLASFRPGLAGMKGGMREKDYPTDSWAAYVCKDPRARKIINQIGPGKWLFGHELLPLADQVLLLDALGRASKLDRISASGRGSRLRKQLHALAIAEGYRPSAGGRL